MKATVHKVGDQWVVESKGPARKVRVRSWEEAMRVVAGPTGKETVCQGCGRPMSSMRNRPIGVYHQRTLLHCHVCVYLDPSLVEVGRREREARRAAKREAEEKARAEREAVKAAQVEARAAEKAAKAERARVREEARRERERARAAEEAARAAQQEALAAEQKQQQERERARAARRTAQKIPPDALTRDAGLASWLDARNRRLARRQRMTT
ncbi:hypothetical protein [Kocuria sp.]|uniref:hypothetical protein n=1 Tax=Kocuria sp. TaxID=1871328 RepID=UPI0026DC2157|nr:hypothetical protein [Kocuria sp.]MDO4919916.1 hypothetical protein [Kocuria sp.]